VLHLHGELKKVRSTIDSNLVYTLDHWELKWGDKCEKGSQLRPHIVWFGEGVPFIGKAVEVISDADIVLVIGTSMVVYPAAGLIGYAPESSPKYYIDPKAFPVSGITDLTVIKEKAGDGVPRLVNALLESA